MIQESDFIITPDKVLSLATNYISRYSTKLTFKSEDNIFFIKSDFINDFKEKVLDKINYKFILLTHDSDFPIEEKHYEILENPNLVMWFGMNCHIIHEKLYPIPIGMANEVWPHGNKETLLKIKNENNNKLNLVYCNFDIKTNVDERTHALLSLRDLPFINFESKQLNFEEYLRKLSTYKYVISPPGNSVDCHRIWEAMYVGTIPICLKSIPLHTFKECPILFLNRWNDITREKLICNYRLVKEKSMERSNFKYYSKLILDLAKTQSIV